MNYPKLRHPNCQMAKCFSCLADHADLGHYLDVATGTGNRVDHLAKYRGWLEKRTGRTMETEWGWALPEVFHAENIDAYVKDWIEE